MIPILSPEGAEAIEEIARTRALLAFDFDGTLAPIVSDRDAAQVRPETRALLRVAALLHPCAVISGRARRDVLARLDGVPLVAVVGSHGAEAAFGPLDRTAEQRVASWREPLRAALAGLAGIDVEDKGFSLAVHYRAAPSHEEAQRRIVAAASALPGARVFAGHAVVNVVPESSHDKGTALASLCRRLGAATAVYVGDDTTDEDAFRAPIVTYPIRVGEAARTAARYSLPDQGKIEELLRALVAARARHDGLRAEQWSGLVRALGS